MMVRGASQVPARAGKRASGSTASAIKSRSKRGSGASNYLRSFSSAAGGFGLVKQHITVYALPD